MQEENTNFSQDGNCSGLEAVSASFRNLSTKEPIKNSVIYFWESHTKNQEDKKRTQATIDLIYKKFDVKSCEKYEVRTGYLSRYNYLSKPKEESTICELEAAIEKGEEEQSEWIRRCQPELPGFVQKNWPECINREKNPHFVKCKKLLIDNIKNDDEFETAFSESVSNYISKRSVNAINSKSYLIEENAWILTLPLLHPNKQIYIIHVGNVTQSTLILFSRFSYLRDSTRLLLPVLCNERFNCMADFLMEYKNKKNYGYSHPVDDDKTINFISSSNEQPSESSLLKMFLDERSEKELLSSIISKMPGHVYWISKDGTYLGCNDLQAQRLGLGSREEIVGKTNYNLLPEEEARKHNNINKMVVERGILYSGEETSTMQGGKHSYLSYKVPLFNSSQTKVVGLLGISIDITDRKRADEERKKTKELKFQNKLQEIKIQSQEESRLFTSQMAHDIVSPLKSLEIFIKHCSYLEEKDHSMLRNITKSIGNIANDLLYRYKEDQKAEYGLKKQDILIFLALLEAIEQKEHQYNEKNIEFKHSFDQKDQFAFIKGDQTNFNRMISNLINNAVEAFEGKPGVVEVTLKIEDKLVKIGVNDNGKGMSQETVAKILADVSIDTTKSTGYGLGLRQIKDTLYLYNGKIWIESKEGTGTKITIAFPLSEPPAWITDRVVLRNGSTVVILDDDESMHGVWENLLKKYSNNLTLKFFTKSDEAVSFIDSFRERDKIFLLSDYDLRSENSGLITILEAEMKKQSLIVTSIHNDRKVQEFIKSSNLKMLPKQFLNNIQIILS